MTTATNPAHDPHNGRVARSVKFHIAAAVGYIGVGWLSCWQVHDRMAKAPDHDQRARVEDSAIGPDQAPRFWDMQTGNFARIHADHEKLRENQQAILLGIQRIESRLK